MNKPNRIVTHPGPAHLDDLWACALMSAAHGGLRIERRDPTPEDLDDLSTVVLDQGRRHEPTKHNFDHHQPDPRMIGRCAASLVLEHLTGMDIEKLRDLLPWLAAFECWDSQGPAKVAETFGLSRQDLGAVLLDPTGRLLADWFSEQAEVVPESALGITLRQIGDALLHAINIRERNLRELSTRVERVEVAGLSGVVVRPREGESGPPVGLNDWLDHHASDTAFSIAANGRGGTSIYRRIPDAPIDFHKLSGMPGIIFIHTSGFLAVVDGTVDDALRIAADAVTRG